MKDLNVLLSLALKYDEETGEVTIENAKIINNNEKKKSAVEHVLTETELRYNILTLGAGNGRVLGLEPGTPIRTIEFQGTAYTNRQGQPVSFKVHKSIRGRIDGLSEFYRDCSLQEEDRIIVTFNPVEAVLAIERG